MSDKIFVNGMIFKEPPANAPDFVKGRLSVKVSEFAEFAAQHQKDGWLNIDLKESQGGKYYAELNTYQRDQGRQGNQQRQAAAPRQQAQQRRPEPAYNDFDDDIPF